MHDSGVVHAGDIIITYDDMNNCETKATEKINKMIHLFT